MQKAAAFKEKGNASYKERRFAQAAVLYTRAIQVSPKPEPVFYSNRAACTSDFLVLPIFHSMHLGYVNMSPPQHEMVVEDCNEALKLDIKYVKALNRRAGALEALERYEEALRGRFLSKIPPKSVLLLPDYTAATILDKFTNQATATSVERVLQKLATKKAAEILTGRQPRLPSYTFISAYLAAFRPRWYSFHMI